MTGKGHWLTGVATAIAVWPLASRYGFHPALVALALVPGATAPDWLECPWYDKFQHRRSLITHRTITHWWPLWLALLGYGCYRHDGLEGSLMVGFALGGFLHLLMDVPNPRGIPIFTPRARKSLNWWKSGQHELLIISAFMGMAALAWQT